MACIQKGESTWPGWSKESLVDWWPFVKLAIPSESPYCDTDQHNLHKSLTGFHIHVPVNVPQQQIFHSSVMT